MEDNLQEDPSMAEIPSSGVQQSPLNMDCESAILFVKNHIQNHKIGGVHLLNMSMLSNTAFLDQVSEMLLIPALTENVGIAFHPLLPALVGRWAVVKDRGVEEIACAFGRLIYLEPRLKRYCHFPLFLISDTRRRLYSKAHRFYELFHLLPLKHL